MVLAVTQLRSQTRPGEPQISCAVLPTPFASFPNSTKYYPHRASPDTLWKPGSFFRSGPSSVLSRVLRLGVCSAGTLSWTGAAAGESRLPPEVAAVKRIDRASSPVVTEIFKHQRALRRDDGSKTTAATRARPIPTKRFFTLWWSWISAIGDTTTAASAAGSATVWDP